MKKIKIEIEEWSHTCGDGCCYTYGTDVFINGEWITCGDYNRIEIILKEVLESLNFDVEI